MAEQPNRLSTRTPQSVLQTPIYQTSFDGGIRPSKHFGGHLCGSSIRFAFGNLSLGFWHVAYLFLRDLLAYIKLIEEAKADPSQMQEQVSVYPRSHARPHRWVWSLGARLDFLSLTLAVLAWW